MLKKVKNILEKHDIDYWIAFGTLLGYVRDKKFIPWDEDIDIATCMGKKVRSLKKEFEKNNLTFHNRYEKMKNKTTIFKIREKDAPRDKSIHVDIYAFSSRAGKSIFLRQFGNNIIQKMAHNLCITIENFDDPVTTTKGKQILKNIIISIPFNELILPYLETIEYMLSKKEMYVFPSVKTKQVAFYDMNIRVPENAETHLLLIYGKNWMKPDKCFSTYGIDFGKKIKNILVCEIDS